jgi:dethiobiotin synthetase
MPVPRKIFVTGTDTNVGKTWISCLLIRRLTESGNSTGAYKPACSGVITTSDGTEVWEDVRELAQACSTTVPDQRICPQTFRAPLAPNEAARAERRTVHDALLADGLAAWNGHCSHLVIEGAGGLFCPLSDQRTVLDLLLSLQTPDPTPAVVVAANRLGVISHTRLTIHTLQQAGIPVAGIVLNQIAAPAESQETDPSLPLNAAQLIHWIPEIPLLNCNRGEHSLSLLHSGNTNAATFTDWLQLISSVSKF